MINKICLGTAQFGSYYGVANKVGFINEEKSRSILKKATEVKIRTLDTAKSYPNSENILGQYGVNNFQIITKINHMGFTGNNVDSWVNEQFNDSLKNLKLSKIYGLLFHTSKDLDSKQGIKIIEAVSNLKERGDVQKIGVSVYDPKELDILSGIFNFDLIQIPLNIFDRRFEESGWLEKLKKDDVEIHARSIFLQGLLLLSENKLPEKFKIWKQHFMKYYSHLSEKNLSPLEICLAYPLGINELSKIVIGVDSPTQLEEIVKVVASNNNLSTPLLLKSNDENLINPSLWPTK